MKNLVKLIMPILAMVGVLSIVSCSKDDNTDNRKLHTITFDSNGGTDVPVAKVRDGDKLVAPTAPTRKDFIFKEWRLDGVAYDFNAPVKHNITLVAEWEYTRYSRRSC